MRLWIDLVNSPHVRLFSRLLKHHENQIEDLLLTTRDYGYLRGILNILMPERGKNAHFIGQWGANLFDKLAEHCKRTDLLGRIVSGFRPDVATSKASPELARVAFGLGVPSVNISDNDLGVHVSKLVFPLSQVVVVPKAFPDRVLRMTGAVGRVRKFEGVTEAAHVLDHLQSRRKGLGLTEGSYIVVRPGPRGASYLNASRPNETLENVVLGSVRRIPGLRAVFFPRDGAETKIREKLGSRVIVQVKPIDAMPVLERASAFIGAGGTMTREAALLGTPTVSVFPGDEPAPTALLIERGLILRSFDAEEIAEHISAHIEDQDKRKELKWRAERFVESCEDPAEVLWEEIRELAH